MVDDAFPISNFDNFSWFSYPRLGRFRVSSDIKFGASKFRAQLREGPNLELDASSADVLASSAALFLANVSLMNHRSVVTELLVPNLRLAVIFISMIFVPASHSSCHLLVIAAMFRLLDIHSSAPWFTSPDAFLKRARNGISYPTSNVSARAELETAFLRLLVT